MYLEQVFFFPNDARDNMATMISKMTCRRKAIRTSPVIANEYCNERSRVVIIWLYTARTTFFVAYKTLKDDIIVVIVNLLLFNLCWKLYYTYQALAKPSWLHCDQHSQSFDPHLDPFQWLQLH